VTPGVPDRDGASGGSDGWLALTALAAVALFPLLFALRRFDDNTLTAWRWAVRPEDGGALFLAQIAGIGAALVISRRMPRRPGLFLFILAALVAVPFWSVPEVVIDSGRYFTQARHLALNGTGSFLSEWGGGISPWTDLPLVPMFYGILFRFLGEHRAAAQALTSLMFAATAAATCGIGTMLWNREVGFLGGLLLLASPYLYSQVPLFLVDVPTMCVLTVSVLAFLHALRRGGPWRILLASAAILAAMLTKYSAWIWHATTLAVILATHLRGGGKADSLRRAGAIAFVAGGAFLALAGWKYGVIAEQIGLLRSYQMPGLGTWGESHLSTFLFQTHPFVTGLALFSVLPALRRRDADYPVIAWLPLLAVLVMQVQRARYLLPVLPMLSLMAAYGLAALGDGRSRRFTAWCAVSFSLTVALLAYRPFLAGTGMENLRQAGRFLGTRAEVTEVEVYTIPREGSVINLDVALPILDLYTPQPVVFGRTEKNRPPREKVLKSSYRFTWELDLDGYGRPGPLPPGPGTAVLLITGRKRPALPPFLGDRLGEHRLVASFEASSVFRFKTFVYVYLPGPPEL